MGLEEEPGEERWRRGGEDQTPGLSVCSLCVLGCFLITFLALKLLFRFSSPSFLSLEEVFPGWGRSAGLLCQWGSEESAGPANINPKLGCCPDTALLPP